MQQQQIRSGERAKVVEQEKIEKLAIKAKKGNEKFGKSGSKNRFAILESIEEKDEEEKNEGEILIVEVEEMQIKPRKARVTAARVADLMKSLKTKRK